MAAKKKASTKKKSGTKASSKKKTAKSKRDPKPLKDEDIKIPEVAGSPMLSHRTTTGPEGAELHRAMKSLMGEINKDKPHKVMATAAEVPNTYEVRRPSGIMQLDVDTGGGLPAGTLNYISGPDGAGKSWLIQRYMLMNQKLYGAQSALALGLSEGGFDFKRALNMGLKVAVPDETINHWNISRQQMGMPAYTKEEWVGFKEQTGAFMIIRGATGEEVMTGVLEAIRSKLFSIVALDSVSALIPQDNASKDLDEENRMAAHASLVTKFMLKYMPLAVGLEGANYTTTIFTAQVRANMQKAQASSFMQKFLKDWAAGGAWAARHAKSIDIVVWNGGKVERSVGGNKKTVGKVSKYELLKGKHGTHEGIQGEYKFFHEDYLPPGIDDVDTVMVEGMRCGVIKERNGAVVVNNTADGIVNLPTLKRMMEIDFDFELAVRREVLASKGITCLYR